MERERALRTGSFIVLSVNLVLFGYKLIIGFIIHSFALISDSFNSLTDSLVGASMFAGIVYAYKPPDEEHPFGHGRVEHIILFFLAVILIATGIAILAGAYFDIRSQTHVKYSLLYIALIAATIPVKFFLGLFVSRLGKEKKASFMSADNWHEQSDNLVTAAVIIGIAVSGNGFPFVDPAIGGAIAVFLVYLGVHYGRKSVTLLMGGRQSFELIEKARKLAFEIDGVREVGDIEVHEYGERVVVNITIVLSGNLDANSAHLISHKVQDKLIANGFYSAHTHVDTRLGTLLDDAGKTLSYLTGLYSEVAGYHGLEIRESLGTSVAEVHIAFIDGVTLDRAHEIAHDIDKEFRKKYPGYKLLTHLEPYKS